MSAFEYTQQATTTIFFVVSKSYSCFFVYFEILYNIQTLVLANNLEAKNALGPLH